MSEQKDPLAVEVRQHLEELHVIVHDLATDAAIHSNQTNRTAKASQGHFLIGKLLRLTYPPDVSIGISGDIDGTNGSDGNAVFTLDSETDSLVIHQNGAVVNPSEYTLDGRTVTFSAPFIPLAGSALTASGQKKVIVPKALPPKTTAVSPAPTSRIPPSH